MPQSSGTAQVFDSMFGTKYHTPGAELQLPRKVPMRVEPKSYFGERGLLINSPAVQRKWVLLLQQQQMAGWGRGSCNLAKAVSVYAAFPQQGSSCVPGPPPLCAYAVT